MNFDKSRVYTALNADEELKHEAIQYAVDYPTSYGKGYKHKDLRIAYLAGAEFGYNKAKEELKLQIEQMKLCQNCRFEFYDDMEEPCRNCSRLLGDIKRKGTSDKWEKVE